MGYTHYWYRKLHLNQEAFRQAVQDFKKLLPRLEECGVKLGNGHGRGDPELTDEMVIFNGLEKCGHPVNHNIVIPWPAMTAGGVGGSNEAVSGTWFAGSVLDTRCCNGDCSYETFYFPLHDKAEEWQT